MKPTDYINGPVSYDENGGQYFWVTGPNDELKMLAEMRGWGAMQNLFKGDLKAAAKFQDELGHFIAQAINEKVKEVSEQSQRIQQLEGLLKRVCDGHGFNTEILNEIKAALNL